MIAPTFLRTVSLLVFIFTVADTCVVAAPRGMKMGGMKGLGGLKGVGGVKERSSSSGEHSFGSGGSPGGSSWFFWSNNNNNHASGSAGGDSTNAGSETSVNVPPKDTNPSMRSSGTSFLKTI